MNRIGKIISTIMLIILIFVIGYFFINSLTIFINHLIKYISNTGNWMTIATTFMAIGTFITIYKSWKDKRDAEKPNISIYFRGKEYDSYFVIKNTGKTSALNLKINTDFSITDLKEETFNSVFNNIIPELPSNFKIEVPFDFITYFENNGPKTPTHEFFCIYEDIYGKKHDIKYRVNLDFAKKIYFIGDSSESLDGSLNKLVNILEKKD